MSSSSSGGSSSRNSENVSIESASPNTGGRAARASASTSSWFKLFSSFPRRSHRHTNIVPLIPDNAISEPRNLSNERNVVTASDEQRSGGLAEAVDPTPAVETASQRENPDTNGTAALQNTQIESESEECVDPDVSNPVSTSSNVPLIEVANAAEPDSVTPRSIPSAPSAVSRTPQPTSNPTEHTIDQSSMRSLPNPAVFPPIHHISRLQQRRNAIDYTAHLIDAAQSDTQTPSLPEIAFFLRNGIIPAQTPLQPPIRATSEDPLITPAPQPRNPPLEYQASRPRGIYINHMPSPNPEEPDQPIYLRHLDSAVTLRDLDALTPLSLNGHLLEGVGEGLQTAAPASRFVQNDSENEEAQMAQETNITRWDAPWQTMESFDGGNRPSSESSEEFIQAVERLFDGHRQEETETRIGGVEMLANIFNAWVERQRLRSSDNRTSNRLENLLRSRGDHTDDEAVPSNRTESSPEAEVGEQQQIPQLGEIQPLRDISNQSRVSSSARLSISAIRSQIIDGVDSLRIEFPEISRTTNSGRPIPQNNSMAAYTTRGRNALSSSSVSGANYLQFSGRHNESQENSLSNETTPLHRLQNSRQFSDVRMGREDDLPPRPQTPRPTFVEDAENNLDPVALFESYINAHIDQSVLEAEEKTNQQNQSQNALSGTNTNAQNSRHSTEEPHPTDLPSSVTNSKSANHLLQHLIPITIPLEHYSRSLTTHRGTGFHETDPTPEKPETNPMMAHVYLDPLRRAPSPNLVAETCRAAYSQQYRIATGETGLARLLDANGAPVSPARWEHVDLVMKVLCEAGKAHTLVRSGFGGDESSSESAQQHEQQQQLQRGMRRGGGEETGRNLRRRVRRESGVELGEVELDGPLQEQRRGFGASRFEARRDSDGAW